MMCDCCGESYDDPNDTAVFSILTDPNGRLWSLCGPCVQTMWAERRPELEPIA